MLLPEKVSDAAVKMAISRALLKRGVEPFCGIRNEHREGNAAMSGHGFQDARPRRPFGRNEKFPASMDVSPAAISVSMKAMRVSTGAQQGFVLQSVARSLLPRCAPARPWLSRLASQRGAFRDKIAHGAKIARDAASGARGVCSIFMASRMSMGAPCSPGWARSAMTAPGMGAAPMPDGGAKGSASVSLTGLGPSNTVAELLAMSAVMVRFAPASVMEKRDVSQGRGSKRTEMGVLGGQRLRRVNDRRLRSNPGLVAQGRGTRPRPDSVHAASLAPRASKDRRRRGAVLPSPVEGWRRQKRRVETPLEMARRPSLRVRVR